MISLQKRTLLFLLVLIAAIVSVSLIGWTCPTSIGNTKLADAKSKVYQMFNRSGTYITQDINA